MEATKSDGGVTMVAIANAKLWRGLIPSQKRKANPYHRSTKQQNGVEEEWASGSKDTSEGSSLGLESDNKD